MKILNVKIFSPKIELLREVSFNEVGLSVIYGDVEKPKKDVETSNSIGKTVLLKIINVIMGAKNSGKDTIKGLDDYIVESQIKIDNTTYNVRLTLGSSKEYYINEIKYSYKKYKEKLGIRRDLYSKQIMLEKRKNLISNISSKGNKEDISVILKLLYLDNIENIFFKIKKIQDNLDLITKFNNSYKDDIDDIQRKLFDYEMKKKLIDNELEELNEKIKKLKLSEEISKVASRRAELDQSIKKKSEKINVNKLKVSKYSQLIEDSKETSVSALDVQKIYESAKVELPSLVKRKLNEIEQFYLSLSEDKIELYSRQIKELNKENKKLELELKAECYELDKLSEIIAENDSVMEAIKIYDNKTKEKLDVESSISELNGKISKISDSKNLKSEIDNNLISLDVEFENSKKIIDQYKEFIYKMVNKIYGDDRHPYLKICPTNSNRKYKTMPVSIDLNYDGDTGEGLTSSKYLIFDYLIMNYTEITDFLIEDSACFEAIDRRQIKNIIQEGIKIAEKKDKQFIISLNKYLLDDTDIIKNNIVISLNENNTLLNRKF